MGAFSLIVVSYHIYIDIYIIMEGVVNVATPENTGSLVENVGNVVEAPSRPSRPRLLDEPLLEEVRRPLRRRRLVRRRPLQAVDNMQSPTPSTSRVSNSPPPPPVKRPKTNNVNTGSHDDDDAADETIDDDEY